jgi:predicted Fe-Mo cluster-binding NifX family protein
MKLCIPTSTNEGKLARVFEHFGSAPYFTVYNSEHDTVEVISNTNQHHAHGACHPLQVLQGIAIDAVVCGGMGRRAIQLLQAQSIKAYRTIAGTVEQTIQAYLRQELQEMTPETGCLGHGCH